MLFIGTSTTKNGRRAQGILHPCRCWESWVTHHHAGLQSAGNPSIESVTPFLSSKLLQDFLVRRQLCAWFLLSNRKDTKTSFCTVGATPSGSCLQASQCLCSLEGCMQLHTAWRPRCSCGPWCLPGVTHVWITGSSTCNSLPARALHCYVTTQAEIHCLLCRKIVCSFGFWVFLGFFSLQKSRFCVFLYNFFVFFTFSFLWVSFLISIISELMIHQGSTF